jgi:hypothetical protein
MITRAIDKQYFHRNTRTVCTTQYTKRRRDGKRSVPLCGITREKKIARTNIIARVRARTVCIISGPVRVLYENMHIVLYSISLSYAHSSPSPSCSPVHGYYTATPRGGTRLEITVKLQRVSIKTLPVCVLIVAYRIISVIAARVYYTHMWIRVLGVYSIICTYIYLCTSARVCTWAFIRSSRGGGWEKGYMFSCTCAVVFIVLN